MGRMWMGTRGHERWVPDCSINPDFSQVGSSQTMRYLNGGAASRRSKSASKQYAMTWNMKHRDDIRVITDLAQGVYDTQDGTNLIYFLDPMALDRNVLSQMYATPVQAAVDGMPMVVDVDPVAVPTPLNQLDYPARSARYRVSRLDVTVPIYVPIPPGHTAWVGAHGSQDGVSLICSPVINGNVTTGQPLTLLSVSDVTRVNTPVVGSVETTGLELQLALDDPASTDINEIILSGIMVQILRTGRTPQPGGFISGQGNAGCEFDTDPTQTPYNAVLDRVGMSAKLIETGPWL